MKKVLGTAFKEQITELLELKRDLRSSMEYKAYSETQ